MIKIGVIGGSGLEDPQLLEGTTQIKRHTPYGAPADFLTTGKISGVDVVLLSRHGSRHQVNPTNINYRANVWALKELGVTHILAPTACGSLREEIKPAQLVFIDQFIDRTTRRASTFYDGQEVMHIPMADPFCVQLRRVLIQSAKKLGIRHHEKGTMVTIEGPRFSTRAESHMFRSWGGDVINMTTVPEVVLAREAGMHYAAIGMSTDYDCWREATEYVSLDIVMTTMKQNAEYVKKLLLDIMPVIAQQQWREDACTTDWKTATL